MLAENNNQYTFEVSDAANKKSASSELSKMFNVSVVSVQSNTRLGKPYSYGKYKRIGKRKSSKKIMVFTLKGGDKISLFEQTKS